MMNQRPNSRWILKLAAPFFMMALTPEVFNSHFSELATTPDATNSKMKLLWLGVGKEDFLYEPAVKFDEYLKEKKLVHQSLITEGGHTWMNARHYLTETLQLFFK
jgi:enterochelin esterase family protein